MDAALFRLQEDGRTLEFSLEELDRVVTGPEEAAQLVAVHMFTDPGSLLYAKSLGGGVLGLIDGRIIRESEVRTEGIAIVRRTFESIQRFQADDVDDSARIINLEFVSLDATGTKISLRVRITLAIGRALTINILSPGG